MKIKQILSVLLFVLLSCTLHAADKDKHFKTTAEPSAVSVKAGEKFTIKFTVEFQKGWHSYSLKDQTGPEGIGPLKTEITLDSPKLVEIKGNISASKPRVKYDSAFTMMVETYYSKAVFEIPVVAKKDISFDKDKINIVLYLQQCTETSCLPGIEFKTLVSKTPFKTGASEKDMSQITTADTTKKAATTPVTQTGTPAVAQGNAKATSSNSGKTESQTEIDSHKKAGIFSFLWFAMTAGALALLTPCVFPMVPITVSFFTKRAEQKKGKGMRDSLVYAIGIIGTFTAIGFILAAIFGASGIQNFATNPWLNLGIAAIFVIFSLNLFGAFEIQLPTGILNKLNSKSQGGGIFSVLLMGLTFSLTSFTCTVPFVGSALVAAAGGEWFYPIIGMLGFATVFAAPFFLLALFPTAMNRLPKAGGWMNNVKVVMGFLEIAAAIKFISNADLVWGLGIMPRDLFIGIWIGCGILITIYVLGLFRLPHDSPVSSASSLRIVFAIFFLSISFYLFAGLTGKQLGELDAFLPPPDYQQIVGKSAQSVTKAVSVTTNGSKVAADEDWLPDYKKAVDEAKKQNKMLFVDFSGFTCTNCRWMELNMFSKQNIKDLMNQMVKVRLFTDRREEPYLSNKQLQQDRYNSIELPLYVIMTPYEKLIGTKAFTRDENEFRSFLENGLKVKSN